MWVGKCLADSLTSSPLVSSSIFSACIFSSISLSWISGTDGLISAELSNSAGILLPFSAPEGLSTNCPVLCRVEFPFSDSLRLSFDPEFSVLIDSVISWSFSEEREDVDGSEASFVFADKSWRDWDCAFEESETPCKALIPDAPGSWFPRFCEERESGLTPCFEIFSKIVCSAKSEFSVEVSEEGSFWDKFSRLKGRPIGFWGPGWVAGFPLIFSSREEYVSSKIAPSHSASWASLKTQMYSP